MIVAPGLVDTHWHLWNTLLRGMSEGGPGYFRLCRSLGPAFGAELFLSPATARTHVSHAMVKLGARDRAQLVVIAYQTGLVSPDA